MRVGLLLMLTLTIILFSADAAFAQRYEAGLLMGGMTTTDHQFEEFPSTRTLRTGTGLTYQVNFAGRIFNAGIASVYLEFPLVVTPKTDLDTSTIFLPDSYSSLFFTPGVKVKLLPIAPVSPYGFVGVGVARLTPGDTRIDGRPFESGDSKVHGAYDFGGGVDVKVFPFVSLRGEIRDIVSGTPQFTTNLFKDQQHNLITSVGIVLRF